MWNISATGGQAHYPAPIERIEERVNEPSGERVDEPGGERVGELGGERVGEPVEQRPQTNTESFRKDLQLNGPASEYFPPLDVLTQAPPLDPRKHMAHESLLKLGTHWDLYLRDPSLFYLDAGHQAHTERMFDHEPGADEQRNAVPDDKYAERFMQGMLYVDSKDFL
ncbi:hypothetical protein [Pandoraea sputorum]|uniref:hypothetical protein n=1 Tax=Pandoraea sputorum TaxID=93222 RepID=UPI00123F9F9A|nr:hypothetical protein [Pandoraea sputorum]VVE56066.1 hypothetical protein PSP20601_05036 [Pandoraea sputorum]